MKAVTFSMLLFDAVQRTAAGEQAIDAAGHFRIGFQRRGMMGLHAGVDHQRACAAPVLIFDEAADSVDIDCRIAAGESDPEEIGERFGR